MAIYHQLLAISLVTLLCIKPVNGHSRGAGQSACINSTMAPNHGSSAQVSAAPYSITVSSSEYQPGASLTGMTT